MTIYAAQADYRRPETLILAGAVLLYAPLKSSPSLFRSYIVLRLSRCCIITSKEFHWSSSSISIESENFYVN